jgi:hypothetical protein
MSRLTWNAPEERFFDTGLDRGVLYPKKPAEVGIVLATNLILNPSFEEGLVSWTAFNSGATGTVSISSDEEDQATAGLKVCRLTASALGAGPLARLGIFTQPIAVVPGATYYMSFVVGGAIPAGKNVVVRITETDNNDELIGTTEFTYTTSGTKQLDIDLDSFTSYVSVEINVNGGTSSTTSAVDLWIDAVYLSMEESGPYFDGDSTWSTFDYAWTGAEHNSPSVRREVLSYAVPWNGLISVDEEGSEGAAAYYVDGRPFLFLPRPKEYKATLTAYTYPDAFGEIMGLTEAADGMFLDSQMGQAFDLSYRTLVGNSIDGVDHGYKIHLVYNATVSPQSLTYESAGNSINPTTFSWEIQAVPVNVVGFRPTAHIIIDTRKMSDSKVQQIEALLYGDGENLPNMPDPQTVFDLLSFGDAIIVIDNGDGTFDVEGSYENVYMIDDGVFRVDNVDATNHGNGTFTISSTNV